MWTLICLIVKMHAILGLYYELLSCHDLMKMNVPYLWWLQGVLSVSNSMGCYFHIAQV